MTITLDSPKLRELSRIQLQSLAKRELVRAIGKTEDIIRRLLWKHPTGVPVLDDTEDPGSASSAPPNSHVLEKTYNDILSHSLETHPDPTDSKGKGKQAAEVASPSPSSSAETLELLYPDDYDEPMVDSTDTGPESTSTSHPIVASVPLDHPASGELPPGTLEHPLHPVDEDNATRDHALSPNAAYAGWQVDKEDECDERDELYEDVDYHKGAPTHYMVVDALRQFTTLVNTIPSMETRIAEGRCLLQHTETLLEKAIPDARELVVTREYLETFLLAKMKEKQEFWDGTAKMKKNDRKVRMEWLRAGRKAESEQRWRETNELFKSKGFRPVPFSAFASQSDEEVLDSLQTTPTSSRSGSLKRAREDSVDGDVGGNAGANGESRKRARARSP